MEKAWLASKVRSRSSMNSPMRIVHVSTSDIAGGAGRAAHRLHSGLRRIGQDSAMFVAERLSHDPTVRAWMPSGDVAVHPGAGSPLARAPRSLARYLKSRPPGSEFFSDDRHARGVDQVAQLPEADVVNLHWVARFIDHRVFFSTVPPCTPVVWTLHDMNAFTGGCHYDAGCGRYVQRCGACPQLGSDAAVDLSRHIWRRKHRSYEGIEAGRLHVVTPSRWLAGEARRSTLLGRFPVSVIPNAVDVEAFAPRDRRFARQVLGMHPDAEVVLFVADWADNRRKGLALLTEALAGLSHRSRLLLLSVGHDKSMAENPVRNARRHLGPVSNERLLSVVYSAADVFVIPSVQDNLPNTVLEAMACGTPVVGFSTGGVPDMVRPGHTGLLAPVGDGAALCQALDWLLQDEAGRSAMAANCRRIAVEEYALETQSRRYLELYRRICYGNGRDDDS